MAPQHIDAVVAVHLRAFPGFFLTFLGPRFLREFYGSFLVDPTGIAFVAAAEGGGEVLGSVVGPLVPAGYFKRLLKRRWWAFCLASAAAVLRRPSVVRRLFRAVFYRGESPPGGARALLSSVSVAPEAQGQGVGRALVDAFAWEVRRRGGRGCFLTTDAEGNEADNRFYAVCGWRLESTFTRPDGRTMNRYVLDFPDAVDPGPPRSDS
jgi:GNAT superfamily N-acetyltransferase